MGFFMDIFGIKGKFQPHCKYIRIIWQEAASGLDLTVVTGKDGLHDDGHRLVFAALSSVVASCPEADMLILADWKTSDYSLFLDLVYGGEGSYFILT